MFSKKVYFIFLSSSLLAISSFLLTSCGDQCETTVTHTWYEPIYTAVSDLREAVTILPEKQMEATGKIFFKDGYLFINEPKEGVHIIDNRVPAHPQNVAFVQVPGSFDIAVKDNLLYTDSYMDLVVLDISDLNNIHEVNRIENYFDDYGDFGYYMVSDNRMVTDWVITETQEVYESECDGIRQDIWGCPTCSGVMLDNMAALSVELASSPGVAGSLARFALQENYLYTLDGGELQALDIADPLNPIEGEGVFVNWDIETVFPRGNELFIGASSGMHIFDISNGDRPTHISTYEHINSCDPVIVEGDLAFVTLRSGTECQGFTNQLEIIDISNLQSPQLLHTYEMTNPHGLGKDGNALFICDGTDGLKVFDATDIGAIDQNLLAHDQNIQAYDIIPFNHIAMMIGEDGLYQYDYSDLENIRLLSKIEIIRE